MVGFETSLSVISETSVLSVLRTNHRQAPAKPPPSRRQATAPEPSFWLACRRGLHGGAPRGEQRRLRHDDILRRKTEERKRTAGATLADRNEEKYAGVPRIRTRFTVLVYANMD